MKGIKGLLSVLDEAGDPEPTTAIAPALAAEVFRAAQQTVPPRWLAPGRKPLWTFGTRPSPPPWQRTPLAPGHFEDLRFELLQREASVQLLASYLAAIEPYELDAIYGRHPSRPKPMTDDQVRTKAIQYLDSYSSPGR